MKPTLGTRIAGAVSPLLLGFAASTAQAALIQIDSSQSHATYQPGIQFCDPFFNCGSATPQRFALSGVLQVDFLHKTLQYLPPDPNTDELDLIRFTPVAVDLHGADALGFDFPNFDGILDGDTYQGSEDPCFHFFPGESCWSLGWFGSFKATYDGKTLVVTGSDPISGMSADRFQYRIVGQAVPEPGTLSLLALGGLGLLRRRFAFSA